MVGMAKLAETVRRVSQLSQRSHPRNLMGKRTAQKDTIIQPGELHFPIQVVTG